MSRFARQMILPEVGAKGQARLARAHVLVVGAGGLAAPILQYLAGAGLGQITLMDPDHVEESNLHRQPLFTMADIGRAKVAAARDYLLARNPDLQLHARLDLLDACTAGPAVSQVDLVLDAADSFAASYILSDACKAQSKPLISASVLGQKGYVGGFCGGQAPSLRALFPDLPDSAASCVTAGVMGPVVGLIGALQAQMALQVLLQQQHPSPLGQLMQVDMANLTLSGFRFDGAEEPDAPLRFTSVARLTAQDQIIDLRPPQEAPKTITPAARRILPGDINALEIDVQRPLVLCCRSGVRAWKVARQLQQKGISRISILAAGDTQ
ncbi:putative adenylyltransferase/sulfurtransferase MoeZ [Phaeobacter sp. CECT 5382]|uniref:ThiF family adenylyltransferase n=1 Tax=Phaeobacter sp. CECT 5382 TaxID=1712645 RepID=UPI0006DB8E56|nr:ThiF family adenylyltransferase [Phaeobacter sp. CECT 5382]CUH89452.1 putative adenylyltransferase/sulfurtransferase MoeZ [Phaeobacter sp. CECT 5382]